MAFNTKLDLCDGKFYQSSGQTLGLSGTTSIGKAHYIHNECAYFNTTPRAIPDVQWITGQTSQAASNASNGLTKSGKYIVLGGNLTGDTAICTCAKLFDIYGCDSSNHLSYYYAGGSVRNSQFQAVTLSGPYSAYLTAGSISGSPFNYSFVQGIAQDNVTGQRAQSIMYPYDNQMSVGRIGKWNTLDMQTGSTTFSDAYCNKGIVYGGNYEANFTNLSLVTKQYVCSQTSGATTNAICLAGNGLTKAGKYAILGGTLTGTTTLTAAGGTALLQYGSDYSANYVARTIVDAGYVTGKTSQANCAIAIAPVAITGVTNGLTKTDYHNACLGGNVTTSLSVVPVAASTVTIGTASNKFLVSTGCTTMQNQTGSAVMQVVVCGDRVGLFAQDAVASKFSSTQYIVTNPSICTSVFNASCLVSTCQQPNSYIIQGCVATFPGAQYDVNYAANFTARSLVDKAFVTGCTNAITTNFVCSANNGLTKQGTNVKLGGTLTGNTCITGAYEFDLNVNKVNITGATGGVNLGGSGMKITATVPGSGGLLCLGAGGVVCQTSLASFGGITGGTNGISDCGSQRLGLGGSLCADTIINSGAGSHKLTLGRFCGLNLATSGETDMILVAQKNGAIWLKSETGSSTISNSTANAVGIGMDFNGTNGFQVFDNRAGVNATGIVYALPILIIFHVH